MGFEPMTPALRGRAWGPGEGRSNCGKRSRDVGLHLPVLPRERPPETASDPYGGVPFGVPLGGPEQDSPRGATRELHWIHRADVPLGSTQGDTNPVTA